MILKGITYPKLRTRKGYSANVDKFYQSKAWRDLRNHYISLHPLCVMCQRDGITKEGNVVDHIKPRSQGGESLSMDNLQTLCTSHHQAKSASENNQGWV